MVLPLDTGDNQRVIGDESDRHVRVGEGRISRDTILQGHKRWMQFDAAHVRRDLLRIIDPRVARWCVWFNIGFKIMSPVTFCSSFFSKYGEAASRHTVRIVAF